MSTSTTQIPTAIEGFPSFSEFFDATLRPEQPSSLEEEWPRKKPFPWQERLASEVASSGWPDRIHVPTGLGKTSSIAVAVYELARQCHEQASDARTDPRTAPQRIFHLVNRRTLVDDTHDYVSTLAKRINEAASDSVLAPVRQALARLLGSGDSRVIVTAALHGNAPRDAGWLRATGCVIVTLTPHQFVSRLVMRGFGISARRRSIDAGLVGVDRLVLVDEPQLSMASVATINDAARLQSARIPALGVPLGSTVLLGATLPSGSNSASGERTLSVANPGDDATHHEEFERRYRAMRRLHVSRIKATADSAYAKELAALALTRYAEGARSVVVFANTVSLAQEVFTLLDNKLNPGGTPHGDADRSDVQLITSRFRPFDRDQRTVGGITVATQCLEVGVDVSFDAMVTELSSWESLVQRLGRLNRDGRASDARADLVMTPPGKVRKGTTAVYGDDQPAALAALLDTVNDTASDGIDVSTPGLGELRNVAQSLALSLDAAATRPGTLHSGLVPIMTQTYPTPSPDLPVTALVSGPDAPEHREVLVAWREDLEAFDTDDAAPVLDAETVSVSRRALATFIFGLQSAGESLSDVENLVVDRERQTHGPSIDPMQVRVWNHDSHAWEPPGAVAQILRHDRVVLHTEVGGYHQKLGWTGPQGGRGTVTDVSVSAALKVIADRMEHPRPSGTTAHSIVLGLSSLEHAMKHVRHCCRSLSEEFVDSYESVREAISHVREVGAQADAETQAFAASVAVERARVWGSLALGALCPGSQVTIEAKDEVPASGAVSLIVRWGSRKSSSTTPSSGPVSLDSHGRQVAEWVASDAHAAGLPHRLMHVVGSAGRHHDTGKADDRFQAYLRGDYDATLREGVDDGAIIPLLAKPIGDLSQNSRSRTSRDRAARRRAGVPYRWRHEAESVSRLPQCHCRLCLVVHHLVGSHHGYFRPSFPPVEHKFGFSHAADFEQLNDTYGPWGLAYLEALVRLADWRASAEPIDVTASDRFSELLHSDTPGDGDSGGGLVSASESDSADSGLLHELPGLASHPIIGWYVCAGLLAAANELGDPDASVRWTSRTAGSSPFLPELRTSVGLDALVSLIFERSRWETADELVGQHTGSKNGISIKYQKLGPADTLRDLLLEAESVASPLVQGLVADLAPKESNDRIPLPLNAFNNNSSYPGVALGVVAGREKVGVDDALRALHSLNAGFAEVQCDGGLDRPLAAAPAVNGIGAVRFSRAALAPLAVYGMATIGHTGAASLGQKRRGRTTFLRLPVPQRFAELPELRALAIGVWGDDSFDWSLVDNEWVLEARRIKLGDSEIFWTSSFQRRTEGRVAAHYD